MQSLRMRLRQISLGVLIVTASGPLTAAESARAASRPNIVLIVSDDHGADALGCYGNPVVRTPNLDALAADGTRFTAAFCTSASCSPSRSVLLTGQHSHRNGAYGLQHDENNFRAFEHIPSLPVLLAAAGYRTARVGKFHIAPESVFRFETVLSAGAANDPQTIGRSPVEMAERAREFLTAADPRSFFLYYATDDPHRANAFTADGKPTFETFPQPNRFGNRTAGYPGIVPVVYRPEDVLVPSYLPDNAYTRAELAEYYQAVSRLDQGVGRLVEMLKMAGHYENTLIVYLSDNGAAFPGAKTTLYEPGIRLPCLVREPARKHPGAVQSAMISWADITPTLLESAGVSFDAAAFDGRSFRAGLDGAAMTGWDEIYASHTFHSVTMYYPMRAVRTRRYKLIHNLASALPFPAARDLAQAPTWLGWRATGHDVFGRRLVAAFLHRPEFELYDLERDPDEVTNLADDPARRTMKDELLKKLNTFRATTRDPFYRTASYE